MTREGVGMAGTDNRRCPRCKSDNVARIQWGLPAFTEELERGLESGRVILGGCCISPDSPELHCNDCGAEFGHLDFGWPFPDNSLRAIVYGAAVGDALGVPFEFRKRDTFSCTHMVGGGARGMPAGTFSDDTSLLLATCDSIKAYGGEIETRDMADRFRSWLFEGEYTVDGAAFDVGNATATALKQGHGCAGERSERQRVAHAHSPAGVDGCRRCANRSGFRHHSCALRINRGVRRVRACSARGAAGRELVCRNCRKRAG